MQPSSFDALRTAGLKLERTIPRPSRFRKFITFMFIEKRKFRNSKGLTLAAIYEGENRNAPVVIICHGYKSSKDSPLTQKAFSRKLIERGISVYRFDFTGHGESEGSISKITPLDAYDDLVCAVKNIGEGRFALYGSSFGGFTAILYATQYSVLALALKAPVSDYAVTARIVSPAREQFIQNTKDIDLYEKAKNIKCPTLIMHGDKDDVVPITQSQKLIAALKCEKKLEVIVGADHDIAGEDLEKANTQIADFFKKTLLR